MEIVYLLLAFSSVLATARGTKYCDEYMAKCLSCIANTKCFCRLTNQEVELKCREYGPNAHYLDLLDKDGNMMCPTDYLFTKTMKKSTDIDEPYESKHFCRCTEDFSHIGTTKTTCSGTLFPKKEEKMKAEVSSSSLACSNKTTIGLTACPFPLNWFPSLDCSNQALVLSGLAWSSVAVILLQAVVIFTLLLTMSKKGKKSASLDFPSEPERSETKKQNDCENNYKVRRVAMQGENVYESLKDDSGYLPMRNLSAHYEIPLKMCNMEEMYQNPHA